jgi:diguanylate cyclase (GGDEF)-like protein/PAS domain S-box-containing protein
MALDQDQLPGSPLRAALATWFDRASGWLVLACTAVAGFAAFPVFGPLAASGTTLSLVLIAVASVAAIAVVWQASLLHDLSPWRRAAWRWIGLAIAFELAGLLAGNVAAANALPALSACAGWLHIAFFPCAAIAGAALLWSSRGTAFGLQFWLETPIVVLCIGALLWLVVPHTVAPTPMLAGGAPPGAAWAAVLDGAVILAAAILLLRRSDWQGWPGLVTFAFALAGLAAARLLELVGAGMATGATPLRLLSLATLALAAQFDYLRNERLAPPMNVSERGSPLAALVPHASLVLAGYALLLQQAGTLDEPVVLIAAVVCLSVVLLFARQVLATGFAVALHTGLATRSAEARFAALIRNTTDVIAILGADGSLRYVTATAERIFGLSAEALIGRPLEELVSLDDRARLRSFLARDLEHPGATATFEARIPRGHERQRIVEIYGTNMDQDPAIRGRLLNLRDMTDRKGMEEQLRRLAFHDPLTLLANRALFRDRVEHALAVSKRNNRGVAVMFVDLDNFKKINDTLGHSHGDRVLHKSAQRISKTTRNGDTVARLGGDEFAVLFENLTGKEPVIEIAARIVETLQESLDLPGPDMRVGASIGVAFATPEDGVEDLMRNADVAMYSSKAQGKGRYTIYEPAMNRAESKRQEMEAQIAKALLENQFLLHYQPIVELKSGYLLGVEALLRWRHPRRGLLPPAEFIRVSEETGQIVAIGRWVLLQACHEVRVWQGRLPEGRQIRAAINVSATQLIKSDIVGDVAAALQTSGIEPGCVVIELTESVLMQNSDEVLAQLTQLKKLGVRIAIDDFGTGYSSLSYLHRFPIDILKIDRAFVQQLGGIEDGAGLARAIIALGDTLGLEVVAEGIELEHQQRELVNLGCVAGQGYYFSKPALLGELEYSVHMQRRRTVADTLPPGARITATGRFVLADLRIPDATFYATGTFGHDSAKKSK